MSIKVQDPNGNVRDASTEEVIRFLRNGEITINQARGHMGLDPLPSQYAADVKIDLSAADGIITLTRQSDGTFGLPKMISV